MCPASAFLTTIQLHVQSHSLLNTKQYTLCVYTYITHLHVYVKKPLSLPTVYEILGSFATLIARVSKHSQLQSLSEGFPQEIS